MKKLESGAGKLRVIVMIREQGKRGKSRSQSLAAEGDELLPNLDDCIEAATNAVLRLSRQNEEERRRYGDRE